MAKTWVPKTDIKADKAFAKAMHALTNPKGRRPQYPPRPR